MTKISGGAAALAFGAFAIATLAGCGGSGSGNGSSTKESIAASTSDDWIASVCRMGSYGTAKNAFFLSGVSHGVCSADGSNRLIAFGSYTSQYMLENDATNLFDSYATLIDNSGDIVVVAVPGHGPADDLRPLTKFGFEIYSAQP
ncbi:hypothetical protein GS896_27430 [Rhodococcus hoagii]|nr:hypothetical protein [Prescottella equi]MBM4719751.1 hypothetical protein [Prescottella equi]NKR23550.1 hypothetical protein [Prescottella equi]NKT56296.1 hypothetical protein [Prescottella equi]NKU37542.1 hypothetical protein [Prescottella equi]